MCSLCKIEPNIPYQKEAILLNIFALDTNPITAGKMHCDKHVPKMIVESLQMLGCAVIRHGATPDQMPLTQKGTPLKGGYHYHPCSIWAGDTRSNYVWLCHLAGSLVEEFEHRFGKEHFSADGIEHLYTMAHMIPDGDLTPLALAMPDEYKIGFNLKHAVLESAIEFYRYYYHSKSFASWDKGRPAPDWWEGAF